MSEIRQRSSPSKPVDQKEPAGSQQPPSPPSDATTSKKGRARVPPPAPARSLNAGRIRVVISAIAIGVFLALTNRSTNTLPDTWALCAKKGSTIYTVEPDHPTVECIVLHKEKIVDWGSIAHVRQHWGDKDTNGPVVGAPLYSRKTGLKFRYLKNGEAAYPGFTDAHAHILDYGAFAPSSLVGTNSVDDVVDRLRKYILATPAVLNDTSAWIKAQGWDQNKYPGGQYPIAADLAHDDLLRDRPIVLARVDVHAYWVSPKVIELLGDLPTEVEGGLIVRDAEGKPSGIFVDNAMAFIDAIIPPWTHAQMLQYFSTTVNHAISHGLTSIHDADSPPLYMEFFKSLSEKGALPIRLNVMAHMDSDEYWGDKIEKYAGDRLNIRSVKLFTDGALGSWGAALLEPYSDQPGNTGLMRMTTPVINEQIKRFHEDGWQVNVHCIGDRANHIVLNAFEKALEGTALGKHRHRIEHAQILSQEDLERLGRLGIIASVQPTHATSDMPYAETRLGPDRIKGAYAWQTLKKYGARLTLGSDFPVEGINPLLGFYAAITRLDIHGNSPHGPGGWFPEQRLSREEALEGMTLGAAYAAWQEDTLGSLKPGKLADIVVLNKDIMRIPPSEILTTKVKATLVDGAIIYGGL